MDRVSYKGYIIQAAPYQLAASGEWKININIWHDIGNKTNIKKFSASNTSKTKEEAIQHSINFGMQID